jgi:NADPH:quinone reductase-like Zn-dependent oxidoreductase
MKPPNLVGLRIAGLRYRSVIETCPDFATCFRQSASYPVLAEEAVVPAGVLAAVPDSFSAVEGAAVWMRYCTAYGALVPFS